MRDVVDFLEQRIGRGQEAVQSTIPEIVSGEEQANSLKAGA
jgi:hypothetical protein